ncbi:hypothetical protein [Wolbachia endosymbiont (group A) of Ischnus inquisitorius]|uniref:hypothetical protein n=1 Tax=Wolbachia endosymbiont (group A) of Ischnus inquisitorius TaxID=3077922 RepID=UPI003132AC68
MFLKAGNLKYSHKWVERCLYTFYYSIALFTIIRTDRNMLLACYSHKHISYRIRTIIRKAIIPDFS